MPTETFDHAKLMQLIDQALRSRLRLQEANQELKARQVSGSATDDVEEALLAASAESDEALRAVSMHLLLQTEA